jgi:hypothetical protein
MGTGRDGVVRIVHSAWCVLRFKSICNPQYALRMIFLTLIALLPLACSPLRPVAKIGLLAPFEGLYRRTGYLALDAMRMALADQPVGPIDLLPLALDDTLDPVRSAQKLLADGSVRAVVGPFSWAHISQVQPIFAATPWVVPFAVDPAGGFVGGAAGADWLHPLILAAAEMALTLQCDRLLIIGWPPAWRADLLAEWSTAVPVVTTNTLATIEPADAVLHLGAPAMAAADLAELRTIAPAVPFLLGPQGEDPVFTEQSSMLDQVFWLGWIDSAYEAWAATHQPSTPLAYGVYRATAEAVAAAIDAPPPTNDPWQAQWFAFDAQGQPVPFAP